VIRLTHTPWISIKELSYDDDPKGKVMRVHITEENTSDVPAVRVHTDTGSCQVRSSPRGREDDFFAFLESQVDFTDPRLGMVIMPHSTAHVDAEIYDDSLHEYDLVKAKTSLLTIAIEYDNIYNETVKFYELIEIEGNGEYSILYTHLLPPSKKRSLFFHD
jgi:hypothetical protein